MSGLVPIDRDFFGMRPIGFNDFYNTLDNFFSEPWAQIKNNTFKLDVEEKEHEYLVEAELPGVKKEEINVQMVDDRLCIAVNKQEAVDNQKKNYIHKERRQAFMQRSVYLPNASSENISAALENGVLNIKIPKDPNTDKTRRIDIQ